VTPEDKLHLLLAADRPPARDHAFRAAVAERIARRRAWATVGALAPWAVAAAAALWGLSPVVEPLSESLAAVLPGLSTLAAVGVTAAVAVWSAGRLRRL
jgi:hypothetical protein